MSVSGGTVIDGDISIRAYNCIAYHPQQVAPTVCMARERTHHAVRSGRARRAEAAWHTQWLHQSHVGGESGGWRAAGW